MKKERKGKMVKFIGFRPEHQKLFKDRKFKEIEQEIIPLLNQLAKFIEESKILPFEIKKKDSNYLIGRGWVKSEKKGLSKETQEAIDDWNLIWCTLKDKNSPPGPKTFVYENHTRGVIIFIDKNGMQLGAWEGYYQRKPKTELRKKILENVERYLSLLRNFPDSSYALYGSSLNDFDLPSQADRLINKIKKEKEPMWIYLGIYYPWGKICTDKLPEIITKDIEKYIKPFWTTIGNTNLDLERKTKEDNMKSDNLIKLLKEKGGLDPETLIFTPEQAEKFIAEVQREHPGRIAFLPVRPDWNETKKVFGYYNPLTGLFYPTDGVIVLLNAFRALMQGENNEKYFIILDEMNLARVEYYFSDILSLMENMWKIKEKEIIKGETSQIHPILDACLLSKPNFPKDKVDQNRTEKVCWMANKEECENCVYYPLLKGRIPNLIKDIPNEVKECQPIPPRIAYPENLVIIGTVNVDETTFSFAPKVLDRAFQLEFTEVYYKKYLEGKNIKEGSAFYNFVAELQDILKPRNMHFGYRVISEMLDYLKKKYNKNDYTFLNDVKEEAIKNDFDFLIKSKILPKLHGTEEEIGDVLIKLLAFCTEGKKEDISEDKIEELMSKNQFKYSDSAQKIKQMYQNMKATGYCSYF